MSEIFKTNNRISTTGLLLMSERIAFGFELGCSSLTVKLQPVRLQPKKFAKLFDELVCDLGAKLAVKQKMLF